MSKNNIEDYNLIETISVSKSWKEHMKRCFYSISGNIFYDGVDICDELGYFWTYNVNGDLTFEDVYKPGTDPVVYLVIMENKVPKVKCTGILRSDKTRFL